MSSLIKCSKCKEGMFKLYSEEDVKRLLDESILTGVLKAKYELDLRSEFRCVKCGNLKKLNAREIVQAYATKGIREGKSVKEMENEVREAKTETKKEIIQPCQVCNTQMNFITKEGIWKCPECDFEEVD